MSASSSDRPPYARYAFLNPYNLSLIVGAGATAAATGHWWIALCAGASEALWMLFAPDSKLLRSLWFDKVWSETKAVEVENRRELKFQQLLPNDQQRAAALRQQRLRIIQLASENPALTKELFDSELAKLDSLYEDFIDLAALSARTERHLSSFDLKLMDRSWKYYQAQIEQFPPEDPRHQVAVKNLEVLRQRSQRHEELGKNVVTSRGQMDLMENSFRLLADEIVTMGDDSELGERLDDLRIGVQAIREASAQSEGLYEELEPLDDVEEPRNFARR